MRELGFEEVKAIVDEADPLSLLKVGAPSSEYDAETILIRRRFNRTVRGHHFPSPISDDRAHSLVERVFEERFDIGDRNDGYRAIGITLLRVCRRPPE